MMGVFRKSLARVISVLVLAVPAHAQSGPAQKTYHCQKQGHPDLLVYVGDMTDTTGGQVVYHLQVSRQGDTEHSFMGHIPAVRTSLKGCAVIAEIPDTLFASYDQMALREGLEIWQDAQGGVFTIGIYEIYDLVLAHMPNGGQQ